MEDPFIAVVINHKKEYFKSFSEYSGNTWTTDIKKAKIFTKLGGARTRVTLIYNWNKRKKISAEISKIRQYFISGYIDVDETERVNASLEKEEKRRLESAKNHAIWMREQNQREYEKLSRELAVLQKKLNKQNNQQNNHEDF